MQGRGRKKKLEGIFVLEDLKNRPFEFLVYCSIQQYCSEGVLWMETFDALMLNYCTTSVQQIATAVYDARNSNGHLNNLRSELN